MRNKRRLAEKGHLGLGDGVLFDVLLVHELEARPHATLGGDAVDVLQAVRNDVRQG